MSILPNIAVIGGSYVGMAFYTRVFRTQVWSDQFTDMSFSGVNTAQQLATKFSGRFQVLLIEKNSHFQHLFAFPRFAVTSKVDTHKAFIPFTPGTFANCPAGSGVVVRAGVKKIDKEEIWLDRKVEVNGQGVERIPNAYLVR